MLSLCSQYGFVDCSLKTDASVMYINQRGEGFPPGNRSFSLSRESPAPKKYIGNRPVKEAKKMKCYKRLIYKQFFQVSGLCGPQFLNYLPKRFTHLCRALYGDAILVYHFGPPIWPPEINKNIWSLLFL